MNKTIHPAGEVIWYSARQSAPSSAGPADRTQFGTAMLVAEAVWREASGRGAVPSDKLRAVVNEVLGGAVPADGGIGDDAEFIELAGDLCRTYPPAVFPPTSEVKHEIFDNFCDDYDSILRTHLQE